jgi:hypothetical protein
LRSQLAPGYALRKLAPQPTRTRTNNPEEWESTEHLGLDYEGGLSITHNSLSDEEAEMDIGYTRLSNGFSRKLRTHAASTALNYFAYNFIQIHRTLRMTPAMAAGVTDRLWKVKDLVALWESYEAAQNPIETAA